MNKTELLNKLARDNGERLLLARALDKLELARQRNIPACTGFLSPQERVSVENLLNACGHPRHLFFGGYEGAERTVCAFLPDWQEAEDWQGDGGELSRPRPAVHLERRPEAHPPGFPRLHPWPGAGPGEGGDLLVADGRCDVLALEEVADFLVFHMEQAGRVKLKCSPLPLDRLEPPAVETRTIRDTVSSLRLDAVAASGFSLSRGKAADLIASGRVQLNHRECVKPDHAVAQGDVLSCRGWASACSQRWAARPKRGVFSSYWSGMYNGTGKIDRINALAKKAKSPEGLTPEETAERDRLRQEYIAAYRASLVSQLENTYIVEPDGTKHKLGKKP